MVSPNGCRKGSIPFPGTKVATQLLPALVTSRKGNSVSEYVSRSEQEAYASGFTDGQEDILDEVIDIVDNCDVDYYDRYVLIMDYIDEKKKEIESL